MSRNFSIGCQSFERIREEGLFYVDKTSFIRDWWEAQDDITVIARPRQFAKTLTVDMMECFFSDRYAGRSDLFEGLEIWKDEKYRNLQGTFPVIETNFYCAQFGGFADSASSIYSSLWCALQKHEELLESALVTESDKAEWENARKGLGRPNAQLAGKYVRMLSEIMEKRTGKPAIFLLDEYDAPLQDAWVSGYWEEMRTFMNSFFIAAFKDNPSLKALLIGVNQAGLDSVFSGLDNVRIVSTFSKMYETAFAFIEEEVFAAMEKFGYYNRQKVKEMYGGFVFGSRDDIYNPWSIINFLSEGHFFAWWMNCSANKMINKVIEEGDYDFQDDCALLLRGSSIEMELEEHIPSSRIEKDPAAAWMMLVERGYLKARPKGGKTYEISITNGEAQQMFESFFRHWFREIKICGDEFGKALLAGDVEMLNDYMLATAYLNSGFYHEKDNSQSKTPNSSFLTFIITVTWAMRPTVQFQTNWNEAEGCYGLVGWWMDRGKAFILEYRESESPEEEALYRNVTKALSQIGEKHYERELLSRGICSKDIYKYAFVFCGKHTIVIDDEAGRGKRAYRRNRKKWRKLSEEEAASEGTTQKD